MYTAIKGIYENGQIVLQEEPPTRKKMKVLVTFLDETESSSSKRQPGSLLRLGSLKGKNYTIPDDFNDPLDDLKEYME
jgi:hypothetical protein